jgi:N-acetylmuramoyl-L-alanine amidase
LTFLINFFARAKNQIAGFLASKVGGFYESNPPGFREKTRCRRVSGIWFFSGVPPRPGRFFLPSSLPPSPPDHVGPGPWNKRLGGGRDQPPLREKTVDLKVAQRVIRLLKKEKGLQCLMTGSDEREIARDRFAFANAHQVDLFISIQCGHSGSEADPGTVIKYENFEYPPSPKQGAAPSEKEVNEGYDSMMAQTSHSYCQARSLALANNIGEQIHERLKQPLAIRKENLEGLNLLQMPGIRIEMASIDDPKQAEKIHEKNWQDQMAQAVADGILVFRRQIIEGQEAHPEEEIPKP